MAETTIIVVLSTLILAVLVWFLISASLRLWLKLIIFAVCLSLGIPLWFTTTDLKGWATSKELPLKYQLIYAEVIEPVEDNAGLYLLVRPIEQKESFVDKLVWHSISKEEPRLYRMPYDRKDHEMLNKLMEEIRKGETVLMDNSGKGGKDGDGEGNTNGEGEDGTEGEGEAGRGESENGDGTIGGGHVESSSNLGYRFIPIRPRKNK